MPARDELPSTLQRSPKKAQETWSKAHDSAVDSYGEGERAHRTAFAALKHEFEKVGDHWEFKGRRGPSDQQARKSTPQSRGSSETAEGVDANAPKQHLYDVAGRLRIAGRSRMSKNQLVDAIEHANERRTRRSREQS
jgi:cation transport regulator ChaB